MKKLMRYAAVFCAVLLLGAAIFPTVELKADTKTYTVTLRAGNVGAFDTARVNLSGSSAVDVTENYIRFTVARGESLISAGFFASESALNSTLKNIVSTSESYMLLDTADLADLSITKNTDYVLDYAKLVDPVSYSIYYVDAQSGEQIAAPTIAYGNAGDELQQISPIDIAGYETSDAVTSMILQKGEENSVTFHYTYTGVAETVTNLVTVLVPGDTVNVTETNTVTVPGNAAGAAGNAAAAAPAGGGAQAVGAAENIPAEETPQGAQQGAQQNIEDEEVPLGAGDADTDTELEDEEVPLAGDSGSVSGNLIYLLGGVFAAVLLVAAAGIILYRKKFAVKNKKSEK
jgi:hypothetical protein